MAGGAVLREQLRAGFPGIQILLAVCAGGRQSSQQRDHAWPKKPHVRHSGPPYCPAQAPSKETKCASGFYTWPLFLANRPVRTRRRSERRRPRVNDTLGSPAIFCSATLPPALRLL